MRILIVCSGKPSNPKWSFELTRSYVYEQIESLKNTGEIEYDTYIIEGKGIFGYLKNHRAMIKNIKSYSPDLIHAHYGLSGLLASLQRKVPVITTYHGSDINVKKNQKFSYLASKLSIENIFVHKDLAPKIYYRQPVNLIPCGVNTKIFNPMDKKEAREKMGLQQNRIYGLFTSAFDNDVKNYPLAKESIEKTKKDIELIELKSCSREKVNLLLNAVDFLLVTSFSETGPIIVKEAMCCNCPIVSVDVGDVKSIVKDISGCIIAGYDSDEIAKNILKVIEMNKRTTGRDTVESYSLENIAKKVYKIYTRVINNKKEN